MRLNLFPCLPSLLCNSLFTFFPSIPASTGPDNLMNGDDDLIVKGLPQLSTICIPISRRYMLEEAIRRIRGTLHAFELTDYDGNLVTASVKLTFRSHSENIPPKQQEFYGKASQLSTDAIESMCSAALAYLLDMNIITFDDANSAKLKRCQRLLQAEQSWSSVLYDRTKFFQDQLASLNATNMQPHSGSNDNGSPSTECTNELTPIMDVVADHVPSLMTSEETLNDEIAQHKNKV